MKRSEVRQAWLQSHRVWTCDLLESTPKVEHGRCTHHHGGSLDGAKHVTLTVISIRTSPSPLHHSQSSRMVHYPEELPFYVELDGAANQV